MPASLLNLALLFSCLLATVACTSTSNSTAHREQPMDTLMNSAAPLAVCWLGNDSWLLHAKGQLIAFDLDLSNTPERLSPPPVTAEAIAPHLEILFITHSHGDHFNHATAQVLARESKCLFVLPANCLEQARDAGIPQERIIVARPKQEFDLQGIHVQPLHAVHGHRFQTVQRAANMDDCGYVLTFGGFRILQPGDSILMENHLKLRDIDLMFVSPTDHNMAIEPAVRSISTIQPRLVIPQHFGTYKTTADNDFWTVGRPAELRAALPSEFRKRFHQLQQGEVLAIGQ